MGIKLSIVGAGSSYTPELLDKMIEMRDKVHITDIKLMDINIERLDIMYNLCLRFVKHVNLDIKFTKTTDRAEAVKDVDFIITQIRVGGSDARINDERVPLKYGLLGQETTGAGGFAKAMRTVPKLLEIARDVEKYNPNAWILNYTNPTGIVAEAVNRYTKAKMVSLCGGGMHPANMLNRAFGIPHSRIKYDFFGLNHFNFSYNITIDGRDVTDEEFEKAAERVGSVDKEVIMKQRMIPSFYCQYFYHKNKTVEKLKNDPKTRGEIVRELEKEIFACYADKNTVTKPEILTKRGGGEYAEMGLRVIEAIANNKDTWIVVNVPNNGVIKYLPDNAVVETACIVNSSGIRPISFKNMPDSVWGIVCMVKNYEQLAVEACAEGSKDKALLALLSHPLVMDYDVAKPLLNDLLEVNKPYLPQFF